MDAARADAAVTYHEVDAKSVTRLRGIVDPWFLGRYGMNLYRGCAHGCAYCDGRAERYYVAGDFARDVTVKRNAPALLRAELTRRREPGFVLLGGGVSDSYQPVEARYRLARGALEVARDLELPVHVLTKAALVERDLDLLAEIHGRAGAILSFSVATLDEQVRARFEPGAASIAERLRLMRRAKALGLGVGAMAMPVLPGISDQPDAVARLVDALAAAGADFVPFGGLTLRPGVQRDAYLAVIRAHHPALQDGYVRAYRAAGPSGAPDPRYLERVHERFAAALARAELPARPPRRLFHGRVPTYAEVGVLLEHAEAARRLAGQPGGGLGRAGFALQEWARGRLAQGRGRARPGYRDVERDFAAALADGTLAAAAGITAAALDEARRLA